MAHPPFQTIQSPRDLVRLVRDPSVFKPLNDTQPKSVQLESPSSAATEKSTSTTSKAPGGAASAPLSSSEVDSMVQRNSRSDLDSKAGVPTVRNANTWTPNRSGTNRMSVISPQACLYGESMRQENWNLDESAPSPNIRGRDTQQEKEISSKSKLPYFRQSRRWAKVYNANQHLPPPPPTPPSEESDPEMSMREKSFEQQRAALRKVSKSGKDIKDNNANSADLLETHSIFSDSDSLAFDQGLCKTASMPCWSAVKAACVLRPHTVPNKWLKRSGSPKTKTLTAVEEGEMEQTFENITRPPKFHGQLRTKVMKKVDGYGRKINGHTHEGEGIVDLDVVSEKSPASKHSASPLPSLHDPEKDQRFSEECEAILAGESEVDKDWLIPPVQPLASLGQPFEDTDDDKGPQVPMKDEPSMTTSRTLGQTDPPIHFAKGPQTPQKDKFPKSRGTKPEQITPSMALEKLVDPVNAPKFSAAAVVEVPVVRVSSPLPPPRVSSKSDANLATIVQLSKPACIPILNGVRNSPLIGTDGPVQAPTVIAGTGFSSRWNKSVMRVPSSTLTVERPLNSAASTDTLAMIESQVRGNVSISMVQKLRDKTALTVPHPKPSGPSGIPPERPLPDLPPYDPEEDADIGDRGSPRKRTSRPSQQALQNESQHTRADLPKPDGPDENASPLSNRHAKQVATTKGLLLGPANATLSDAVVSPVLPTPSSVYSQKTTISLASDLERPFVRHDVGSFRADRIRSLRKRIKADMSSDRGRRIVEEDAPQRKTKSKKNKTKKELPSLPPLPSLPSLNNQPSIDQLDQFPAVPLSRPPSRASAGTVQSHNRTRSHPTRHSSRASSILRRPSTAYRNTRQILGQSDIKVLVDTNPITGRFRAGAMSPPRSSSSRSNTPDQTATNNKSLALQEIVGSHTSDQAGRRPAPRRKISVRSIKSQASSRLSGIGNKHMKRKSIGRISQIGSDDESSPLVGPQSVKQDTETKVRRRWNNEDIHTVQMLWDDLEDYHSTLMKQEKELRRQAEEIQMMVRVFAPISRAHGMKQAMFLAEQTLPSSSPRPSISNDDAGALVTQSPSRALFQKSHTRAVSSITLARNAITSTADRPVSNTSSSTSETTNQSQDSADFSGAASPIDPFEDVLPGLMGEMAADTANMSGESHTNPAVITTARSHRSRSKNRSHSKTRIRATSRSSTFTASNTAKPLRKILPPTVFKDHRPLSVRNEERAEDVTSLASVSRESSHDPDSRWRLPDIDRLSVNHVLTNTEQMDKAIDMLMFFG